MEPLLPVQAARGGRRPDRRTVLNGILWKPASGFRGGVAASNGSSNGAPSPPATANPPTTAKPGSPWSAHSSGSTEIHRTLSGPSGARAAAERLGRGLAAGPSVAVRPGGAGRGATPAAPLAPLSPITETRARSSACAVRFWSRTATGRESPAPIVTVPSAGVAVSRCRGDAVVATFAMRGPASEVEDPEPWGSRARRPVGTGRGEGPTALTTEASGRDMS
ncbi:hypothetical protein [Actinocorallia herbida]|uniref:hypothetical protein n=1 Tax=Actinocorallia herbida TaxID=58109 RepID=UPI001476B037